MPFDFRRLLGAGAGQQPPPNQPPPNPNQQPANPIPPWQRFAGAGLAGLGAGNSQGPPPQAMGQPPPFTPAPLQGLGQPVQFGQRPPMAPPPAPVMPSAMGGPNLGSNMPPGPAMNLGSMAGSPGSTKPVDPNDPYNLNARNRMLGRF